jgi:hypothetical protein
MLTVLHTLQTNGLSTAVNISNLEDYINLVLHHFLIDGVQAQFQAFSEGFNQVFPLENVQFFTVTEIETLVCGSASGSSEDWSVDCT